MFACFLCETLGQSFGGARLRAEKNSQRGECGFGRRGLLPSWHRPARVKAGKEAVQVGTLFGTEWRAVRQDWNKRAHSENSS